MYKGDIERLPNESVERRRAEEAARKARIFNVRSRVMGVDLPVLGRQVAERHVQKQKEEQREKDFVLMRSAQDAVLQQQEKDEKEMRSDLAQHLQEYWHLYQRAEDSRDADLNGHHKGAQPDHGIEAELGIASMQVFEGEDAMYKQKKKTQMEENKRTLKLQSEEKEKRETQQKFTELQGDIRRLQLDRRVMQLSALEEECKRAARIAQDNYNLALAAERVDAQQKSKLQTEQDNLAEIQHAVTSDFLIERRDVAEKNQGRGVLTNRWKGMNVDQTQAMLRERQEQLNEKEKQRMLERQRELDWEQLQMEQYRKLREEEREVREKERDRRTEMDKYNTQLAREQQLHQQYLKNELYTNKPSVRYFNQFSSNSR